MAVPFNMAVASRLWQTNFRSRSLPIRFFSLASLSFFFLLYTVGLFVYFCSLPVRCFRHFCFVLRVRLRGFLVLCGDNACRTATKRWKKRHKHEQSLRGHCHRLVVLWSLLLPFFFLPRPPCLHFFQCDLFRGQRSSMARRKIGSAWQGPVDRGVSLSARWDPIKSSRCFRGSFFSTLNLRNFDQLGFLDWGLTLSNCISSFWGRAPFLGLLAQCEIANTR